MKEKFINFVKDKKVISYFIIILVTIFCCIPLFSNKMNIIADDGVQHLCRLIGTHASLKEGNIFPVIMSEFCNGFGYSWNIFYSPLTAYLPLIFKIFVTSYTMCMKLFMFFCMLLSGIFMYSLVYKISKSNLAGVVSALIYITTPYHLTDLYNRIAIAELASFVFIPIVFIGIFDLLNKSKKNYYIIVGAIGLILSHNVLTIYTAIFCLIFLLINYKNISNKNTICNIIVIVIIILLCTSFYWIPLLEHYFATTYEVFIPDRMFDTDTIIESKLSIKDLVYSRKWGINLYIGIPIILGIIATILYIKEINKEYKKHVITFLIFGIVSLIMTLQFFPFEYLPNILKMLQFVWRMLIYASFFLSIVAGIAINKFFNNKKGRIVLSAIVFIIYAVILIISSKEFRKEPFKEEKFLTPLPVNSSTIKVHGGCATFEYLPKNAFRNLDYIKKRNSSTLILEGAVDIVNESKNGTKMTLEIKNVTVNTKIELPYIYYLGYSASITDKEGNIQKLKIKESYNGFCMIELSNVEEGIIQITYSGTLLMKISYILTVAGIILLIFYVVKIKLHLQTFII